MTAVTVEDPLRGVAARHSARRALIDRGTGLWLSWFSLDDLAQTWADRLRREGLRPGERVALLEPAGARFAALLFACLRVGAAVVPLSPRAPEAERTRVLADCRPRLLVREGEVETLEEPARGPLGDACVLYTSGTTGPAKGVRLTLANHRASALGCRQALGADEHDRWLLVLGPHHVGGFAMFLRSAFCNQPLITLDRFEEQAVLEAIAEERPTLLSLVPTMLTRLVRAGGEAQLRSLRAILLGGAPARAEQVREWAALALPVCPSYGLTETCSQVATVPPGRAAELAGTAGVACAHASIEVDAGGQIVVSGPAVSPGYVNPAIAPAPGGGRFATGDVGRVSSEGVLTVLGRADDGIVTGGENVQPEEVERELLAHPAVADVAVAGRPDPEWGEIVCAWVVPEAEGVAAPDLDAWCRVRLAAFKIPRHWTFVEALPRSEGGKLRRRDLPGRG